MAQTDGLLTPEEVAEQLRISSASVRRWARDGEIEHVKLPSGAVRIPAAEVARLLTPTPRAAARDVPVADAG